MKKLDTNGYDIARLNFVPHTGYETYIIQKEEYHPI